VGLRAGLDEWGKSRPHRFNPLSAQPIANLFKPISQTCDSGHVKHNTAYT